MSSATLLVTPNWEAWVMHCRVVPAAIQRDLGKLEKWADKSLIKLIKGEH